ncbi:MAG: MtnX-like HAD-IB family phosphatase [Candidatus Omnitrophica bacterium]|nr:MtnX-like HAD-IB family phosphatase [Candidatus Omnitrophota bacterium]
MDFDGTITRNDVVDGILDRFTTNRNWEKIEQEWARGLIGSKECLTRQLADVRLTERELESYLESVELDPGFLEFEKWLCGQGIDRVILSDGFDYFIRKVFACREVPHIPFLSNSLRFEGGRLIPDFPHAGESCGRCGHCKGSTLRSVRSRLGHVVFVGDGLSDLCALPESGTVFAKGRLAEHCHTNGIACHEVRDFRDVQRGMETALQEVLAGRNR